MYVLNDRHMLQVIFQVKTYSGINDFIISKRVICEIQVITLVYGIYLINKRSPCYYKIMCEIKHVF